MDKKSTLELTETQWKLVMQALDDSVRKGGLNSSVHLLPIAFEIQKLIKPETNDKKE
jgi:hypothetical protein